MQCTMKKQRERDEIRKIRQLKIAAEIDAQKIGELTVIKIREIKVGSALSLVEAEKSGEFRVHERLLVSINQTKYDFLAGPEAYSLVIGKVDASAQADGLEERFAEMCEERQQEAVN